MAPESKEMNRWKQEQLECFRRYLCLFPADSREYRIIMNGIRDLELGG